MTITKTNKGQFQKGIHYSPKTEFKKGNIPWNKGSVGLMKPNKTSFTVDSIKRNDYITPQLHNRDGYVITLKDEFRSIKSSNGKIYNHHKRISYPRYLILQAGIEIPKGYVVYHKDGDMLNNDLSNLEVISKADLLKRNRKVLKTNK